MEITYLTIDKSSSKAVNSIQKNGSLLFLCVFLGRTVHTHGKIKGWGKLLKKKPHLFAKEEIRADSEHLEVEGLSAPFYIREDGVEIKRFQR